MTVSLLVWLTAIATLQAAPATLAPTVVSPLVVLGKLKAPPPADATVSIDSDEAAIDPFRVTIYPSRAWERGVGGHVTLTCLIDRHGLAERCRVLYESPQGYGFGAAGLQQQPLLKVPPKRDADGQPMMAEMNIALEFKPPVQEDNIGDLERSCNCKSELPGNKINITHNLLNMRRVVMMSHPAWTTTPSFEDLAAAYPPDAAGLEGFAVVHCEVVRKTGRLTRCQLAKEDPKNHEFGAGALKLAPLFQVSPSDMANAPHDGAVEVEIPVRLAPPAELAQHAVTAPNWLAGFDPLEAVKLFPPEAAAKGLTTGRGTARCVVGPDGGLTQCKPAAAQPPGLGFEDAAARLASTLRMNLWSADGAPVKGGVVEVPIRLNLADAAAPAAAP
jgi:hypothetical protein